MGPMMLALVGAAWGGVWHNSEVVQGLFVVASPPNQPVVAVNSAGHAISAWDDLGTIKFAERLQGGTWTTGAKVHKGAAGGPVQVAIGTDETTAVAWLTVGTEFVPSNLVATVRPPGGAFPAELIIAPGAGFWYFDLAVLPDGTSVIVWADAAGVEFSSLPPSGTVWTTPVLLSDPVIGGSFPDIAVDDLGDLVAVWVQGAAPTEVGSAYLLAGSTVWEAPTVVSSGTGLDVWSVHAGLDAAGNAGVGFVEGYTMVVAGRTATGAWDPPVAVSDPTQLVYSASFAMDDLGDELAAWQVYDASNNGAIWSSSADPAGVWTAPTRLSRSSDSADWPTAALSNDGSVAAVSWTDDIAVTARVSIGTPATTGFSWARIGLASGSYGAWVPVAAGGGTVATSWAWQLKSNPNTAKISAKAWE